MLFTVQVERGPGLFSWNAAILPFCGEPVA